jgi:guanylate kinase
VAKVFVITGPSGVGKGTLIRTLLERIPELELAVSATTRRPRPGEQDGVDYHFLDDAEFDRRVAHGEFVEHAAYSGRRYGTLRSELERRTSAGAPVVLEI